MEMKRMKTNKVALLSMIFIFVATTFFACGPIPTINRGYGYGYEHGNGRGKAYAQSPFILITSNNYYKNEKVMVVVDNDPPYRIKVKRANRGKGHRIMVRPGKHFVQIIDQRGNRIFARMVYASPDSPAIINLP